MIPDERLINSFCANLKAMHATIQRQTSYLDYQKERFHQANRYVNHWNSQQNEVVFIDVGGTRFHTTHSTITRHKDSMLSVLFSKRMQDDDFIFVDDDYVFIDREPKFFHLVLQYLRYGAGGCYAPDDKDCLNSLLADASYYGLEGLRQQLEKKLIDQKRVEMEQLQRSLQQERVEREEEKQRHLYQEQLLQEQLRQTLLAKESSPNAVEGLNLSNDFSFYDTQDYSSAMDKNWTDEFLQVQETEYIMAAAAAVRAAGQGPGTGQHVPLGGSVVAPAPPPPPAAPAKQPPQFPKAPPNAPTAPQREVELERKNPNPSMEFEQRFKEQLRRTQELERVVQMSLLSTPKQQQRVTISRTASIPVAQPFPNLQSSNSPRSSPVPHRPRSPFGVPTVEPQGFGGMGMPRPASSLDEPRRVPTLQPKPGIRPEPRSPQLQTYQHYLPEPAPSRGGGPTGPGNNNQQGAAASYAPQQQAQPSFAPQSPEFHMRFAENSASSTVTRWQRHFTPT